MASLRNLAVLFLAIVCSAGSARAVESLPNGGRPAEKIAFPAITDWNSLTIGLKRTPCTWSKCPSYAVTITGDGTVTYSGRAFVNLSGTHVVHIPPETVHKLFDAFVKAEFFWTLDSYKARMTEQATYVVSIAFDGHQKTVVDYLGKTIGMPPEITALEEAIDAAAGTERWVSASGDLLARLKAEQWDFTATDDEHAQILATAAERGDAALVGNLLAAGVPSNTRFGCKAVAAAASRANLSVLKVLLAAGAPAQWAAPPGEEAKGCNALIAAATAGRLDIMQALLARRPDLDARDPTGATALMLTVGFAGMHKAETEYLSVIEALLEAGADPRLIDKYGRTALDIATNTQADDAVTRLLNDWVATHHKTD